MKTTLKVAELATFIYAILIFGTLCIEMSYFSSFDISIAAYLRLSEILVIFLNKPFMFIPLILLLITVALSPLVRYEYSASSSLKKKYEAFSIFSFIIILVNMFTVFCVAYLYEVLYSVAFLFSTISIVFFILLPNPFRDKIQEILIASIKNYNSLSLENKKHINKILNKQIKHEQLWKSKLKSEIKKNNYIQSRRVYSLIDSLCSNSFIYGIVVSYVIIVAGLSIINLARAGSYIENELSINTTANIVTESESYICDNKSYMLISESIDYVYIYDKSEKMSIVIPRSQIIQTKYSLSNKSVISKRSILESQEKQKSDFKKRLGLKRF